MKVATIARTRGLRGELILDIHPSMHEAMAPGTRVLLTGDASQLATQISSAHSVGGRVVVTLDGIDDRTVAESWRGAEVSMPRSLLPRDDEHQFFDFELIGADVVDETGVSVGVVTEILSAAANDVYVARGTSGEILIPATAHAVLRVDREARRITVDPAALVYDDEGRDR